MNGTNDGANDIILRSTDNGYLRTSKMMLSDASQLFRQMFLLPQSPDQEINLDGLAVISVEEDTSLLQHLLLFCNPASEMVQLHEVQRVAMKYQMNEAAKRILRERTRSRANPIPPVMLSSCYFLMTTRKMWWSSNSSRRRRSIRCGPIEETVLRLLRRLPVQITVIISGCRSSENLQRYSQVK